MKSVCGWHSPTGFLVGLKWIWCSKIRSPNHSAARQAIVAFPSEFNRSFLHFRKMLLVSWYGSLSIYMGSVYWLGLISAQYLCACTTVDCLSSVSHSASLCVSLCLSLSVSLSALPLSLWFSLCLSLSVSLSALPLSLFLSLPVSISLSVCSPSLCVSLCLSLSVSLSALPCSLSLSLFLSLPVSISLSVCFPLLSVSLCFSLCLSLSVSLSALPRSVCLSACLYQSLCLLSLALCLSLFLSVCLYQSLCLLSLALCLSLSLSLSLCVTSPGCVCLQTSPVVALCAYVDVSGLFTTVAVATDEASALSQSEAGAGSAKTSLSESVLNPDKR